MNHALISLGANDTNKATTLARTLDALSAMVTVLRHTPIYDSPTAGAIPQPPYANALLEVATDIPYDTLRCNFKDMERAAGRNEHARDEGIVPLDIDIVSWNGTVIKSRDMEYEYMKIGLNLLNNNL